MHSSTSADQIHVTLSCKVMQSSMNATCETIGGWSWGPTTGWMRSAVRKLEPGCEVRPISIAVVKCGQRNGCLSPQGRSITGLSSISYCLSRSQQALRYHGRATDRLGHVGSGHLLSLPEPTLHSILTKYYLGMHRMSRPQVVLRSRRQVVRSVYRRLLLSGPSRYPRSVLCSA
jgi:hypothetical protein